MPGLPIPQGPQGPQGPPTPGPQMPGQAPIQLIQQMMANMPKGQGGSEASLEQLLQTGQLPPELLKQLLAMLSQQKMGGQGIGGTPTLGQPPSGLSLG